MIIVMAGLPGSGKTTLAKMIAKDLPASILSKDELRSAIFPPEEILYSNIQDDFVVGIMLQLADFYLANDPGKNVIIDGRTFSKKAQVRVLLDFMNKAGHPFCVIQCHCSDETTKHRLEYDVKNGSHPAANRTFELFQKLRFESDELEIP
ncbi:MAG TPA: hypothetical protein DDZ66_14670, partial [Firmicutes bacterium]|nr:hypothetical protein [Bacillota bacterium]